MGHYRKTGMIDIWKSALMIVGVVVYAAARPALTFSTIGSQAADSGSQRIGTAGVQMRGSGAGLDKKADNVLFAYGNPSGNIDINAYCAYINDTLTLTESGIMVRTAAADDAACIALLIQHERGMSVKYRTSDGKNLKAITISSMVYNYLRIQRTGNNFYLYCKSTSEGSWTQMGSAYTLNWPSAVCAGIVHASGAADRVTESHFNVINGLPEEQPAAPSCEPLLYDFEGGVPLATLGFREINKWMLDPGKYIRTDIAADSIATAHILTPSFLMPLGIDTVTAAWNFYFNSDTTPYLYDYGLYSKEALSLNDRAKITAPRIGSAAKVITGIDDTLYTSVFGSDSVILYDRTKVYGNVTTGKYCRLINGAAVYGAIAENTAYSPPVIPVYTVDTGTVSPTVNVGDSLDLAPGNYATLTVNANAKVRFRSGTYQFSRLISYPDVKLYMATDSTKRITIRVRNSLQIADRNNMVISGPSAARRNVTMYAHQSTIITMGTNLRLYGYFFMPNAEVKLVSRGTIIDGGLYAKKISFEPDIAITVNNPGLNNDWNIASLKPENTSQPVYSIRLITHSSALQDTMTDIVIKRDTTTVAAVKTGAPTPLKKWLSMQVRIFKTAAGNRLRLLFNNGASTMVVVDTLPFTMDTLAGIAFDHRKNGFVNPITARIDNIALSCVADSCPPVIILTQPVNDTVYEGGSATFSCSVNTGSAVPVYQWYRDGTAIPWANQPSYAISVVKISDKGATFQCRITGACGYALTNVAILEVDSCKEPQITAQPEDDTVMLGQTATFSVTAQGSELTYVWKRNDDTINGVTGAVYTIASVQPFNNFDRYRVIVTNGEGCEKSSQSRSALLVIPDVGPCRITGQPKGDTLLEGDYFRTNIITVCNGGVFTWYRNGVPVGGATTGILTYGPVYLSDNNADFYCIVANGTTSDTSAIVRLIVRSPSAMGGSIAISGELFDGNGKPLGTPAAERFDMTAKLYTRKTGGEPVYTEIFSEADGRGIFVDNGAFTVTLGRGATSGNLQKVAAANKDLHAELYAGRNGGLELIAPRLRLTAAPYAFTAGVKVIYGEGSPVTGAVSAPLGTMYVDRSDGDRTWKLAKTGWVSLE